MRVVSHVSHGLEFFTLPSVIVLMWLIPAQLCAFWKTGYAKCNRTLWFRTVLEHSSFAQIEPLNLSPLLVQSKADCEMMFSVSISLLLMGERSDTSALVKDKRKWLFQLDTCTPDTQTRIDLDREREAILSYILQISSTLLIIT